MENIFENPSFDESGAITSENPENGNNQNDLNGATDSKLNSKPLSIDKPRKPLTTVAAAAAAAGTKGIWLALLIYVGEKILWEEAGKDLYDDAKNTVRQAKDDVVDEWRKYGGSEQLKDDTVEWLKGAGPIITAEEFQERYNGSQRHSNDFTPDWIQPVEQPTQLTPIQPVEQPTQLTPIQPVEQPTQLTPIQPVEQPTQPATPVKPVEQPTQPEPVPPATDQSGNNAPIVVPRSTVPDDESVNGSQSTKTSSSSSSHTESKEWKRSTSRLEMFDRLNKRDGEDRFARADRLGYGESTRAKLNIAPRTQAQQPNQTFADEHRN